MLIGIIISFSENDRRILIRESHHSRMIRNRNDRIIMSNACEYIKEISIRIIKYCKISARVQIAKVISPFTNFNFVDDVSVGWIQFSFCANSRMFVYFFQPCDGDVLQSNAFLHSSNSFLHSSNSFLHSSNTVIVWDSVFCIICINILRLSLDHYCLCDGAEIGYCKSDISIYRRDEIYNSFRFSAIV